MSKYWDTTGNAIYDDEDNTEPIVLEPKNETELISMYREAKTEDELDAVYDATLDFNVDFKISQYKDQLNELYSECFEEFMNRECPTHIFDTGLYNNRCSAFIECIYTNSEKGKQLNFISTIQQEYFEKEAIRIKKEKELFEKAQFKGQKSM